VAPHITEIAAMRKMIELLDYRAPIGTIAAAQLHRLPTDPGQDVRHCAAAIAAAPAVNQRAPVARLVGKS
jgi:hypothetical protein